MAETGAEFQIGINSDAELQQTLQGIINNSGEFISKIDELNKWFSTEGNLWEGEDAVELRRVVTQTNPEGVLVKMNKYSEQMKNMKALAESLINAIDDAQKKLKANITTAMEGGE